MGDGKTTVLPKQARAKKTYENILAAAQRILDESGIEALNSNAIVDRAGVTAPVFYRYFKDKYDLLMVLAERLIDAQNEVYERSAAIAEQQIGGDFDVEAISLELLKQTYVVTRDFIGSRPLLVSLRAIPALSSVRVQGNHDMAVVTARHLRMMNPELDEKEAYDRARLAIEIGYSAIEMLLEELDMSVDRVLEQTAAAVTGIYTR